MTASLLAVYLSFYDWWEKVDFLLSRNAIWVDLYNQYFSVHKCVTCRHGTQAENSVNQSEMGTWGNYMKPTPKAEKLLWPCTVFFLICWESIARQFSQSPKNTVIVNVTTVNFWRPKNHSVLKLICQYWGYDFVSYCYLFVLDCCLVEDEIESNR